MAFKSKFHFLKVYVLLIVSSLFYFGLGYLIMFEFQPKPENSRTGMLIFGGALITIGIYSIYTHIKQLPVIRIDYNGIILKSLFTNQQLSWSDIESVKYTGKDFFWYVLPFEREAMVIQLTNSRSLKIFYEHYSNGYLIQQYIKSYHEHQHLSIFTREKKVMPEELIGESFTVYKGTPLWSFRGITIWGFIVLMLAIMMKTDATSKGFLPLIFICLFWYAANSYFCFYIKVSDNYLVIKNYFIPFLGKKYRLSDIQEMAVETYRNWPNCLRVTTNSFQYKVFPCGPIRDKEWNAFMAIVRKKGIKVRNEAIY
jgi:hypothetical protein